jgi:hypothetical protein
MKRSYKGIPVGALLRRSSGHVVNPAPLCAKCSMTERSMIHSPQPIMDGLEGSEECHPFEPSEAASR